MDPLTALAVAAAVVQFVDFGSRLVKRTWDVYKNEGMKDLEDRKAKELQKPKKQRSTHLISTETENDQLEGISNELKQLAQSMRDSTEIHHDHRPPTKAENDLLRACEESEKVNVELQDLLAKISKRPTSKRENAVNYRLPVARIWGQDKIGQMEHRMEDLRRLAMGSVLVCLW